MRQAIVVDAGCDLSEQDRKSLGIELWPIEIVYPNHSQLDHRDEAKLLELYRQGCDSLLEATTRPMELLQARSKLMEYATRQDELLYLSIMTTRSPAMAQAKHAADSLPMTLRTERKLRNLPHFKFLVADSQQLFAGYAWIAAFAALQVRAGTSIEQVLKEAEKMGSQMAGYLIPGELRTIRERAKRKGEKSVGWLTYAIGSALDIKPIIACRSGHTGAVGKVRGFEQAVGELVTAIIRVIENDQLSFPLVCLVYGGDLKDLHKLAAINQLDQLCRKKNVRLLRSMMSVTGLVNVGAGGLSIAIASREVPYGDFSTLR